VEHEALKEEHLCAHSEEITWKVMILHLGWTVDKNIEMSFD